MKKLIVCEKCHKWTPKENIETIVSKTYKNKNHTMNYCKDCINKMLAYQQRRLLWEREKSSRK